jgi:hypothetical protein
MNIIQNQIWNQNYHGEGSCAELETYLKKLDYGSRTGVFYLPWAVVERIFKEQGGTIELLSKNGTTVEVDRVMKRYEINEDGTLTEQYAQAFFINVRVEWLGLSYVERYPLQDSSGRALLNWTQNDLNKAFQRAKVKAIANISGIGYKLFETGDLQFDDNTTAKDIEEKAEEKLTGDTKKKLDSAKPKPAKKTKPAPKPEEESTEDTPETAKDETTSKFDRTEYENEIKELFISSAPAKQKVIKEFLTKHETTKIQTLSDEHIVELHQLCNELKEEEQE